MKIKLHKHMFGFGQNCTLEVENKMDGVHITVIKAEYPRLIDENVVFHLINQHRSAYDGYVSSVKEAKKEANSGFLAYEIATLEERLARAKFAQKIAKRNKVIVVDKTDGKPCK